MALIPMGAYAQYTSDISCTSDNGELQLSSGQSIAFTFTSPSSGDFFSGFDLKFAASGFTAGDISVQIWNDTDPTDGLSNSVHSQDFTISSSGVSQLLFGNPPTLGSGKDLEYSTVYTIELTVSGGFNEQIRLGSGCSYSDAYFYSGGGYSGNTMNDPYFVSYHHEDGTYANSGGNWTTASNWSGPTNNVVPPAGVDIKIDGTVTYDESNEYTSSPKRYNDITFKNGNNRGLNITGGDLVFTGDLDGPDGGSGNGFKASISLTSGNSLVAFGSNTVNIVDGEFEIENGSFIVFTQNFDMTLVAGNSITIKDNGLFLLYENNANFVLNGSFTVQRGGIFYVVDNGGSLTIDINNNEFKVETGGVFGDLGDGNATIDLSNFGQLLFEPGATYYEGTASSTYTITGGTPRYQYEFENTASGNWHHIAFPFNGMTWATSGISGDPINPNFNSGQYNIFTWDASEGGTSGVSAGWTSVTSSSSTITSPATSNGDAYAVYTGGTNFPVVSSTATIRPDGTTVTIQDAGTHTYDLEYLYDAAGRTDDKDRGWNFIPNPFLAYLNIDRLVTDADFEPTYDAIHYWDASQGKYIAYVDGAGTIIESSAQSGNTPTAISGTYETYISPFRGFWVKATATSQSIQIKPSMRVITGIQGNANDLHHELKTSQSTPELMRIMTENADGYVYEVVWNHLVGEDSEFGPHDAYARAPDNPNSPMLGDITSDGSWAVINSLDMTSFGTRTVGFKAAGNQLFTWKVDTVSVPGVQNIFLLDKKTGVVTDLLVSDYSFANDPNYAEDRFEVSISGNVSITENPLIATEVMVVENGLKFAVQNGEILQITGSVMDLQGRLVFDFDREISNGKKIELPSLSSGVYVVTWADNQGHTKSQKVIIH